MRGADRKVGTVGPVEGYTRLRIGVKGDTVVAGDIDSQYPRPNCPYSLDLSCTVVEGAGSRNPAGDMTGPGMTVVAVVVVAAAGELCTVDSVGNPPRTGG